MSCDCEERIGVEINSYQQFEELKNFFNEQIENGTFAEIKVEKPHYVWNDEKGNEMKWYADKWYKCNICNTVWEFDYPDFPATGFVRKING